MIKKLLDRLVALRPTRAAGLTAAAVGLALVIGAQATFAVIGESPPPEATPTPTEAPSAAAATEDVSPSASPDAASPETQATEFNLAGGGARLIVNVSNKSDASYDARGRSQLNRIPGPRVGPVNAAIARSTCVDCETLAVALQISVYERGAPLVAPQNAAVAVNGGCIRCFTMAVAIQYLIPVEDDTAIPADVRRLAKDLNAELKDVMRDKSTSVRGRLTQLFDVIGRFRQFAAYVDLRLREETEADSTTGDTMAVPLPDETDDPAATLAPDSSASPSTSTDPGSPTPTAEPSATPSPTAAPDPTESPPSESPSPPPSSSG
jgi:hypothetical protein